MFQCSCTHSCRYAPGPFGVALSRLQSIGVHWMPESQVLPLLPGLQDCHSFAGLKAVDVGLTRQLIATFDGGAQAVLGVALSGKCYTENELCHFRQSDDDEMQ